MDPNVFSPANYGSDLSASFQRQSDLIAGLTRNKPAQLPPAHKLTKVGGPVNLGTGPAARTTSSRWTIWTERR
jgi:hypothetical protein